MAATTKTKNRLAKDTASNGEKTKGPEDRITISPPNIRTAIFKIVGTAPYVQHAWSKKAIETMKRAQLAGSQSKKGKKREPKNFEEDFEGSKHVSRDGWYGIPAPAFRNACISACRICGFKMTHAKLSVFVEADGYDRDDGTPLVKITKGEPHYCEHMVRIQSTTDIRARAMWDPGWEATVQARFDGDQFSIDDVANLLLRAGMQVGIGEGRPDSRDSAGMGWGLFELKEDE